MGKILKILLILTISSNAFAENLFLVDARVGVDPYTVYIGKNGLTFPSQNWVSGVSIQRYLTWGFGLFLGIDFDSRSIYRNYLDQSLRAMFLDTVFGISIRTESRFGMNVFKLGGLYTWGVGDVSVNGISLSQLKGVFGVTLQNSFQFPVVDQVGLGPFLQLKFGFGNPFVNTAAMGDYLYFVDLGVGVQSSFRF